MLRGDEDEEEDEREDEGWDGGMIASRPDYILSTGSFRTFPHALSSEAINYWVRCSSSQDRLCPSLLIAHIVVGRLVRTPATLLVNKEGGGREVG